MMRIYARILAAALGVIAIAAALRISSAGLGLSVLLSVLYLGSAAIFAYGGFSRRSSTIIRSVVAVMGILLFAFGALYRAPHGHPGVPLRREGLGRWASASCCGWVEYGMRGVVAL
jgi:hypothetical protein